MTTESAGGPLSADEVRALCLLLARFAEHELDQFEFWKVDTPKRGTIYVEMGLEMPNDGRGESAYTSIWPLPTHLQSKPSG